MLLQISFVLTAFLFVLGPNSNAKSVKDCEKMQIPTDLWAAAKAEAPAEDLQRCSLSVDSAKACCLEHKDKMPNGKDCYRKSGSDGARGPTYTMYKQCLSDSQNVEHDCRAGKNGRSLSGRVDDVAKCYWLVDEEAKKNQPAQDNVGCVDPNDAYCRQNPPAGGGNVSH